MKRILSLLICAMLIISSMGVVGFASEEHWSYDYIKGMIADGVISGDSNGNLKLDNNITRAEFAKTINKYFGFTVKADTGFNDVSSDKWYYEDMLIAKGTGYMIGSDGNANPDANITRAEAFVIIARLLGLEDDNTVSFTDASSIPDWAKGKIGALVKEGIVSGYSDGSIKANGSITRAEAFVIVSKNERTAMPDDAEVPGMGNTSSMVNVNVPSPSGASRPSGGGSGGGGGASVVPNSTVDFRAYDDKTFAIEYTATNFKKVSAVLTFENAEYTVELVPTASNGNQYKASLKDAIVNIVNERNSNGDSYTLSLETTPKAGYKAATTSLNKTFVADILPELTGFDGGINLATGEYEYSWDAIAGITDYAVNVYSDDTMTTKVAELSKITTETSVKFNLDDKPLGTAFYVTVAVKNGNFEGIVAAPMATMAAGISGGDGSKENPYVISAASQFKNIFSTANTNTDALFAKHYVLISDIDLSSLSFVPAHTTFKGSLKGFDLDTNKETVRKINVGTITNDGHTYTAKSGTNWGVAGILFDAIDTSDANVSYLEVSGNLTSNAAGYVGGIIGAVNSSATVSNLTSNVTVTSSNNNALAGGIAGVTYQGAGLTDCTNNGDVTAIKGAGGIIGCAFDSGKSGIPVTNCANTGNMSAKTYAGGIVAQSYATIENCYNTGDMTIIAAANNTAAGGIVGYNATAGREINNCWNSGTITSPSTGTKTGAGGILGMCWAATPSRQAYIANCFNIGKIVSDDANCKGAAIGNTHGSTSTVTGFYDAVNEDYPVVGSGVTPDQATASSVVLLSSRPKTGAYGETYKNIWTIAKLCEENTYFKANGWTMAEGYPLPQLAGTPYAGEEFVLPAPPAYEFTSEVKYQYNVEKTAYTLTWDLDSKVAGYNVYVDGELIAENLTEATYDIPVAKIVTGEEEIIVSAVVDAEEYFSDALVITYGGGKGTEEDPYLIYTLSHLKNVSLNLDANYMQMVDITEALTAPLATHEAPFTGSYVGAEGSNKKVALDINGGLFASMFGATDGATIKNITVTGTVVGDHTKYAGVIPAEGQAKKYAHATAGLVAVCKQTAKTTIEGCVNEASVSVTGKADIAKAPENENLGGYTGVAGICGYPISASIVNCVNKGMIDGNETTNTAGIAGYINGNIDGCVNYGTITGGGATGGIVGALYGGLINCANIGTVSGTQHVGGVAGSICGSGYVKNSYNSGKVTGTGVNIAGIAGRAYLAASSSSVVENCFNTGDVVGSKAASILYDFTRGKVIEIKNTYDIANPDLGIWGGSNVAAGTVTVANSYVLNGINISNGGSAITAEEAKALLSSDTTFLSDVWEVKTEGDYLYPVLKAVPYEKVETMDAITITLDTSNDKFVIKWNLESGVSYDVYVGTEKVATLTTNSYDVTEYVVDKNVDVYVIGTKGTLAPAKSNSININNEFAGGSGTEADPYLVASAKQFANVAKYPSAYFKQTKDIEGVTEIITPDFTGVYDGNGKELDVAISTSSIADKTGWGLFKQAGGTVDKPAVFKNIILKGTVTSTATTAQYVGGLLGAAKGSSYVVIENCVNYATVKAESAAANSNIGGLLGRGYTVGIDLINCVNYGSINGGKNAYTGGVGGMAGNNNAGTIAENCANYGDVTGKIPGGVLSWTYANIINCFNFGKISSIGYDPAGIVAYTGGKTILVENCFNAGELVTSNSAKKLFAILASNNATTVVEDTTVKNCYNTFDGAIIAGALSGKKVPVVEACYNVTAADTTIGVTNVTLSALKTLEISDAFTLLEDNKSNSDYNKGYVYPQLKTNLVDKDFEVPGAPETLEIKDIYFDDETADWMVKIDPTKNTEIATYTLEVGDDIVLEFEKSDLNADNAIALEKIAIGETTVSLTAYNSSNAPVLEAEDYTVDMTVSGGNGSEEEPYIISHAEQFVHFFGEDNTAEDMAKHYLVVKDINLSDLDYVPSAVTFFSGSLKGYDLKTSTNVKREINIGDVERTAASVDIKAGTKKNVGAGVINTANAAKISHFIIKGKLTSDATEAVGGFIAYDDIAKAEYSDIENHVDIIANSLTTKGGAGGIFGFARTGLTNCANYGDIECSNYCGGLIGYTNSNTPTKAIVNCVNYGNLTAKGHTGGLMGSSYHAFTNCANFGDITGAGYTGGIAGYHSQKGVSVESTFNAGNVTYTGTTALNGVGAIVGGYYFLASNGTPSRPFKEINNTYNIGVINPGAGCKGSVIGNIQSTGAGSYERTTIKGYYDLANKGFAVYGMKPKYDTDPDGVVNVVDSFIVGDADGDNTATLDSMKALTSKTGTMFANSAAWEVNPDAAYKYPTLVTNPFDDNLEAFTAVE